MGIKLKKIRTAVIEAVKHAPVEILMGTVFFVLWIVFRHLKMGFKEDDVLMLFPLFISLSFICNTLFSNGLKRLIYYLSFFFFIPFVKADISAFVHSDGYGFALLAFGLLIISRGWKKDNLRFAERAVRCILDFPSGVFIAYALCLAVIAIYASVTYIFNIAFLEKFDFYSYAFAFTGYISLPVAFISFDRQRREAEFQASKVFDILLNFILSPAVIIYTSILYIYFAKILILWELPKGKVAYMVFAFILSAVIGQACQPLLKRRFYDWFYRHFSWISFPPLILFWVGASYRINEYGYTEDRVYLILLGALATFCMLIFLNKKTAKYLYVTLVSAFALSLFTFVPGISARDIAFESQTSRVDEMITKLRLADSTGRLRKVHADNDTTFMKEYRKLYGAFLYVDQKRDSAYMVDKYGFETAWGLCDSIVPYILRDYVKWGGQVRAEKGIDYSFEGDINIAGFDRLCQFDYLHRKYINREIQSGEEGKYAYLFADSILTVKGVDGRLDSVNIYKHLEESGIIRTADETAIRYKLNLNSDKLKYIDTDLGRIVLKRVSLEKDSIWSIQNLYLECILVK